MPGPEELPVPEIKEPMIIAARERLTSSRLKAAATVVRLADLREPHHFVGLEHAYEYGFGKGPRANGFRKSLVRGFNALAAPRVMASHRVEPLDPATLGLEIVPRETVGMRKPQWLVHTKHSDHTRAVTEEVIRADGLVKLVLYGPAQEIYGYGPGVAEPMEEFALQLRRQVYERP